LAAFRGGIIYMARRERATQTIFQASLFVDADGLTKSQLRDWEAWLDDKRPTKPMPPPPFSLEEILLAQAGVD
jgi:hypothetical protein